ncbi:MAG TPA: tripartite tricarboxylate transporter substrate binding protein [Xanthobacteraceae bacterium]|jgi:tripartite-type tricarboxylate transporter receptor subunit TctC
MFSRRRSLQWIAAAAVLPAIARPASAQAYPTRSVKIVVGYTAGGVSDLLARLIGPRLSDRLGQPFVVENRPGAAGNVAADVVVHAPADGYTLLLAGISNAINAALYPDLDFNFVRDVAPVAIFSRSPLVMEVSPSFPATSVGEFITYAKAHPGAIAMGSAGTGGATHVAGELFQMLTATKMLHVPYRGSPPALSDLLGGRVQVMFDNVASSIALIRNGKLRPLAVSSSTEALPGVALISDFVPGYEAYVWNGIAAPKDTPAEIVSLLNANINAIAADPAFRAQMAALGNTVVADSPVGFGKLIADDTKKWTKVVKFAGIKPE